MAHSPSLNNGQLQQNGFQTGLCCIFRWQPSDDFEDPHNVPLQLKRTLHAMKNQLQPAPHQDFLNCLHHNDIHRMQSVMLMFT